MKFIVRILIFAGVVFASGMGLWMYLNGYLTRTRASNANEARYSFADKVKKAQGGDVVQTGLSITGPTGISAVDVSFETIGENLNFLYAKSTSMLPIGFDAQLLEESATTTTTSSGTKSLKRLIFISKKKDADLPNSIFIPLHFAVVSKGQGSEKSTIKVNIATSQISGPGLPNSVFPNNPGDGTQLSFTVEIDDPRAAMIADLACDDLRNTSTSLCGRGVGLKWTDVANEEGYKVYKNGALFKTLGKDADSFSEMWCPNFNTNTYSVIAYNSIGSVSTSLPTVSCGCSVCPTPMPPTPTPIRAENSADLIFRAVFPDAAPTVNEIPNVKILVLDNNGKRICDGDTDCSKVVSFKRVVGARIPNTFSSPQLQYPLKKNQAYSIVIKHTHTVQQTYKHIYLKWQKILQCLEGTTDTGCGELIEVVVKKPLFSGDVTGDNKIDQTDADMVTIGVGARSAEGDLNFDGTTDQSDVEVLGKNFSKKGT